MTRRPIARGVLTLGLLVAASAGAGLTGSARAAEPLPQSPLGQPWRPPPPAEVARCAAPVVTPCFTDDGHVLVGAFAFDYKHGLDAPSRALAEVLAAFLEAHPEALTIEVQAHVNRDCEHCARDPSQARATALVQALRMAGVAPERLEARGFGDRLRLHPEWSRLGRRENPRIELVVTRWRGVPPPPPPPPFVMPASDEACRAHPACAREGACHWSGSRCVPDAASCRASELCRQRGQCAALRDACRVGAEADCRRSEVCVEGGACSLGEAPNGDPWCLPTGADCKAATACRRDGRCTLRDGFCAASVASCRRSERCRDEGRCQPFDGVCEPTRAAHCLRSSVCKRDGRCALSDGLCVEPDAPR